MEEQLRVFVIDLSVGKRNGELIEMVNPEFVVCEGMQIEDANIPVEAKADLLNALSETGLKNIVVGSFVSPKYTPQMKNIEAVLARFKPKEGVTYTAMIPNDRGTERAKAFSPPPIARSPTTRSPSCSPAP